MRLEDVKILTVTHTLSNQFGNICENPEHQRNAWPAALLLTINATLTLSPIVRPGAFAAFVKEQLCQGKVCWTAIK